MTNLSTEAQALHAIIEDDLAEARRLVLTLLPGECRELTRQAHALADLCARVARERAAQFGPCEVVRACTEPAEGYVYPIGDAYQPEGACAAHLAESRQLGLDTGTIPEVKL